MKKKLVYIFLTFSILLVVLYLFRYKQAVVFTDRIPKDATSIININTRQLEHHILADFMGNPGRYLKSDATPDTSSKDSISKEKHSLTKGIDIPINILFYTNATNYNYNWYSGIIDLNNPDELSKYLLSENFKKEKSFFIKDNIIFAIQDKQLVIVITYNEVLRLAENIDAIFDSTEFLSDKSRLLSQLVNSKSDISYSSNDNHFLEGNFIKGSFVVKGKLNPEFNLFLNNTATEIDKRSILSLVTKINKDHRYYKMISEKMKSKFTEFTQLSLDTITSSWNGVLDVDFKEITSKIDSIISYEYDDDFNKIEKVTTQKIEQPNLSINFGLEDNTGINTYLIKQKSIKIIDGDSVFTKIPLYKFYVATTANNFTIYTQREDEKTTFRDLKFESYFNIEKHQNSEQKLPFWVGNKAYLDLVKNGHFQLSKDNELSIVINAVNKNRNLFGLLIKPN